MRALVIGASGQLGRALLVAFADSYELVPTANRHRPAGYLPLDLSDLPMVQGILQEVRPDLVLIAGAMCAVDGCELEPDLSQRINVVGPQTVAEYAHQHNIMVVFYSTDHVFDGSRSLYHETDVIHPLNAYAKSKAAGEAVLREVIPDQHLILRTSWLYGPDVQRMNFPLRCLDCARAGQSILVPQDQWGSPTYTEDLARATRFLIAHGHRGTFHVTGPDFIDRASLGRRICAHFGLDDRCIVPKATSELGQAARRPLQVRLDCRKLQSTGVGPLRGIGHGLEALGTSEASLLKQ